MVNFVIYERDGELSSLYRKVIDKFLSATRKPYRIYECDPFDGKEIEKVNRIVGAKIFIMNLDCDRAYQIARELRNRGDFESQIILLTRQRKENVVDNLYNILYLDLIQIDERMILHLLRCCKDAYRIVTRYAALTFTIFDELYRLPYDDIYFIMKNTSDNSVTIYTKDDSYLEYTSLKGVVELLENDPRFFRSHRSCILNLYKVESFDKVTNVVTFNNGMKTNLVSKHRKAEFEERLRYHIDRRE